MKSLGVGPMASWNIFSFGRNKAMVDQARAAAAEAALVYRETVLEALHDVETSWSAYEKESRREDGLRAARDHQRPCGFPAICTRGARATIWMS